MSAIPIAEHTPQSMVPIKSNAVFCKAVASVLNVLLGMGASNSPASPSLKAEFFIAIQDDAAARIAAYSRLFLSQIPWNQVLPQSKTILL